MAELRGSLNGIGLSAIVQFIGDLRHSGSLELSKGATRAVLGFDSGRLVAADFAEERGYRALATMSLELADGDFTVRECEPTTERTLDVAPKDLQTYLSRVASGEDIPEAAIPLPADEQSPLTPGTCPLLGFADDRGRHYSRATALHRCFASGAPDVVPSPEQRDLCLSGSYPTCPRYRNGTRMESGRRMSAAPIAAPPSVDAPPLVVGPPRPNIASTPPVVPTRTVVQPLALPAGVVALLESVGTVRRADATQGQQAPPSIAVDTHAQRVPLETRRPLSLRLRAPPRKPLWIAGGILVVLLVAVNVALVIAEPTPSGTRVAPEPSVASVQSWVPVAISTDAPTVATSAAPATTVAASSAQAPILAPGPAAVARPSTPTAPPSPTIAPGGQPLLDVRFAREAGPGWLDNPPFAAWSDGAYRLQARQVARFVAVGAPIDKMLGNVVVSATFRKTPGGGYGLVLRDQAPGSRDGANQTMNAYVLEAGDLGEFGVWRRDGDHWVDLVPWTPSAAIRAAGSPNELTVRAIGARLSFSINGVEAAAIDDDTLPTGGGVGVFVGGDFNQVALDHFTVEVPD